MSRRARASKTVRRSPVRVAPSDDPAETVEHLLSRRQLIVEDGDVVVEREVAGIWHGGPGLMSPTTIARLQYRVCVRGQQDDARRIFEMYDGAVADGEALAADRRVRLFYSEGADVALLKDYRPSANV